jgi:hypothetical protein
MTALNLAHDEGADMHCEQFDQPKSYSASNMHLQALVFILAANFLWSLLHREIRRLQVKWCDLMESYLDLVNARAADGT